MRKNLLLILMAVMLPCIAMAENMAVHKTRAASYGSTNVTENRLGIPCESAGFSSPMNGSENYTFATWVKPSNVYGTAALIALSPQIHMNTNGNWVLTCNASGVVSINGHAGATDHGSTAAGINGSTSMTVALGEWNYIAVVVDNTNLKFTVYLNGEVAIDKNMNEALYFPADLQTNDGPVWFHVGGQGMDADIDEVHAFNRALSAEEVAQAYKNPVGIDGLTGYYTFDEQAATPGYFDNLAEGALENSSAVFWNWTGVYLWGGWINGSNTATEATLVEGREIAGTPEPEPEPVSRSYTGKFYYAVNGAGWNNFEPRTLNLYREADGTYTIFIAEIPFNSYNVEFKGITREGNKLTGHMDKLAFMGYDAIDANLEGTMTESQINIKILATLEGLPIDMNFEGSNLAGVGSIGVDAAYAPAEYFTLQGIRVAADNLTPGFYIVRRGTAVTKVYISK